MERDPNLLETSIPEPNLWVSNRDAGGSSEDFSSLRAPGQLFLKRTSADVPRPAFGAEITHQNALESLSPSKLCYRIIEVEQNEQLLHKCLHKYGLQEFGPESERPGGADSQEKSLFSALASAMSKTAMFLANLSLHEVFHSSDESLVAQMARGSKVYGYLQAISSKTAFEIITLFIYESKLRYIRWPKRPKTAEPQAGSRVFVAWKSWDCFSALQKFQSSGSNSGIELGPDMEFTLEYDELCWKWTPPPLKHFNVIKADHDQTGNSPNTNINCDSLEEDLLLSALQDGQPLRQKDKRAIWSIIKSDKRAKRQILQQFQLHLPGPRRRRSGTASSHARGNSASSSSNTAESSFQPQRILVNGVATVNKVQSEFDPHHSFLYSGQPYYAPVQLCCCRQYEEFLCLRNVSESKIKVHIECFSEKCFIGYSRPKIALNPGEKMDVRVLIVGLQQGTAKGLLMFTFEDCKSNERSIRLLPIKCNIQTDGEEDFWDIDLSNLVYDKNATLGEGSSSIVYLANFYGIPVACKEFKQLVPNYSSLKLRSPPPDTLSFLRECRILKLKNLEHPNLIRYFGASKKIPQRIITERMSCTLSQWLARQTANPPNLRAQRIQIALNIANGLQYLHKQGLIHRDLKSPNILLDEQGCAKIGDLGMAELIHEYGITSEETTGSGSSRKAHSQPLALVRAGSLPWMAPELREATAENRKKAKPSAPTQYFASDVYSFGVLLFEIWSNKCLAQHLSAPTDAGGASGKVRRTRSIDNFPELVQSLEFSQGTVEERVVCLIRNCCAKEPTSRLLMAQIVDELNLIASLLKEEL